MLPNEREPDTVPLLCGVKATLKDTLSPAGIVNGKEGPSRTNWELLLLAEDTLTVAPMALIVMGSVSVFPMATLPKFSGTGATTNWPAAVPVPVRGTFSERELATKRFPPTVPCDCGVNVTLKVTLCPAARVKGRAGPLVENPLPVVVIAERVKSPERAFVSTTGTVALVPIATLPNDAMEGLAVTASLLTPVPST